MTSAFRRVYGVLVLILALLALLAFGGISMAERVREVAHWNRVLPSMGAFWGGFDRRLVAEWLDALPGEKFERTPVDTLSSSLRHRLRWDKALVERRHGRLQLILLAGHDSIWLDLGVSPTDVLSSINTLARLHAMCSDLSAEDYARRMGQSVEGIRVYLQSTPLDNPISGSVIGDDFRLVLDHGIWSPEPSPWVLFFTLVYVLIALALVVFRLVSLVETRLHHLEQTTRRLAQGHLSARVAIRGDDPISRLGDSFNKTAEHIRRLLDIQREMVRAVSHELRTPISRMTFALESLHDMAEGQPVLQRSVTNMDGDLQELEQLVDEILTYARLEEGGPLLEFERTSLEMIVRQVVSEAHPGSGIVVEFDGSQSDWKQLVELEPRYVHRAIQNLVGNACRYAKSRVVVRCSIGEETCRVDVEDNGPGVPESDWGHVFMAFARLDDSRTRKSGGFGLGLSIVRRIAYWHGGRAIVGRSEALKGARFSLVWPRYQSS